MSKFKPLLAETCEDEDLHKLDWSNGIIASIKLDGIRCLCHPEMGPVSRKLKPIPNRFIQKTLTEELARLNITGIDGELLIGDPSLPDFEFGEATSGIMSFGGEPQFTYWVFDTFNIPEMEYSSRLEALSLCVPEGASPWIKTLTHYWFGTPEELRDFEEKTIAAGHEGVMLRKPNGRYKFNRSTLKEQILLKRKPFEEEEAVIIGFTEQMENTNEATVDELGHTKRSSHQTGKVPKGTLGTLIMYSPKWGEFEIGGGKGMTHALRKDIWEDQAEYRGRLVTFRYQKCGIKDKPRIPQFKAFRDDIDYPEWAKDLLAA